MLFIDAFAQKLVEQLDHVLGLLQLKLLEIDIHLIDQLVDQSCQTSNYLSALHCFFLDVQEILFELHYSEERQRHVEVINSVRLTLHVLKIAVVTEIINV